MKIEVYILQEEPIAEAIWITRFSADAVILAFESDSLCWINAAASPTPFEMNRASVMITFNLSSASSRTYEQESLHG